MEISLVNVNVSYSRVTSAQFSELPLCLLFPNNSQLKMNNMPKRGLWGGVYFAPLDEQLEERMEQHPGVCEWNLTNLGPLQVTNFPQELPSGLFWAHSSGSAGSQGYFHQHHNLNIFTSIERHKATSGKCKSTGFRGNLDTRVVWAIATCSQEDITECKDWCWQVQNLGSTNRVRGTSENGPQSVCPSPSVPSHRLLWARFQRVYFQQGS